MSSKFMLIKFIIVLVFSSFELHAQKKFVGSNGSSWLLSSNWEPAGAPDSTDDVILDNSTIDSDYLLTLPDTVVTLHSLRIAPGAGRRIELVLPASNKLLNTLRVIDTGFSIIIRRGGVFRNASGLTTGQSMEIAGLWRIENDGRYVHNTRALHATGIVGKLSHDSGTVHGIFEFDVPGNSYSVSISNREYGRLIFSAKASLGQQIYRGSGTNSLMIHSDLELGAGVRLNISLDDEVRVEGDFVNRGGIFNFSGLDDTAILKIKGDFFQGDSASVTRTGSGTAVLELTGDSLQQVDTRGSIGDSITVRVNNRAGLLLKSKLLIPYRLEFMRGKIRSSREHLLVMADNSTVSNASKASFVDGPMQKVGDEDFEFPVGKENEYAPVRILGAGRSGDVYQAEYFLSDPSIVYGNNFENPPMVRISTLEHWRLERLKGTSTKRIELSVRTSSNATTLDKLVVARWEEQVSRWKSEGNFSHLGTSTGTLLSNEVSGFGAFTLASTAKHLNPLPLHVSDFRAERQPDSILFRWSTAPGDEPYYFDIESSLDGSLFKHIRRIVPQSDRHNYTIYYPDIFQGKTFFRLKAVEQDGSAVYSSISSISKGFEKHEDVKVLPTVVINDAVLALTPAITGWIEILVSDVAGRNYQMGRHFVAAGMQRIRLDLEGLPAGFYVVQVNTGKNGIRKGRFVKR